MTNTTIKTWVKVSDTRHELRKGSDLVGCIHLTDLGWGCRVWFGKSVSDLGHRSDELLAKLLCENNS